MRRRIHLFFICMFVFVIFFSMSPPTQASEQAPPVQVAAPAQISQEAVSGEAAPVVMDAGAHAVLATDSFDFGSVYEGNDVFHDFIIKNEGTADLKIINVKSG